MYERKDPPAFGNWQLQLTDFGISCIKHWSELRATPTVWELQNVGTRDIETEHGTQVLNR